jgi:uncharacterized membrane protein YbhN (UPF0104 family)
LNRRWPIWLGGLLTVGSLALLIYLFFQTRPKTVLIVWKRFPWSYFILAQGVYVILNFLRALRFGVLLKGHQLSWRILFIITSFSNLSSRILPFRSGDLMYPLLLRRHVPGAWSKGFGGVTGSLLFDLLSLMTVSGLTLIAVGGSQLGTNWFSKVLIAAVCLFLAALGGILSIGAISTSLARFLQRLPGRFWQKLADGINALSENLLHFRDKKIFGQTLLISLLITGAVFSFNLILLIGQGVWTGWMPMLVCVALGVFVSSWPLALFGLGLIEGAWVLGLVNLAGQSVGQAVALGIFLHSCQIGAAVLTAGAGFLLSVNFNNRLYSKPLRK